MWIQVSPRSRLRRPLPRVHSRASNAELYANSPDSRIPELSGLLGSLALLEEREVAVAREQARVEVADEQSTERLQVLSGLIAQVQEYLLRRIHLLQFTFTFGVWVHL